jgi:hypothetical protein
MGRLPWREDGSVFFARPSTGVFFTWPYVESSLLSLSFLTRATYPAHPIHLDLITLITFDEEYKLWNSTLSSLPQPPATSRS